MNAEFERRLARLEAKTATEIPQASPEAPPHVEGRVESERVARPNLIRSVIIGVFMIVLMPTLAVFGAIFYAQNKEALLQIATQLGS